MEQLITLLVSLLFGLFDVPTEETVSGPTQHLSASTSAVVTRVIDGDTINVRFPDGAEDRVRYIGIDTPELRSDSGAECYATAATVANEVLVANRTVTLVSDVEDTDRFGRLLRYVYVDEVFINAHLVQEGYADTVHIEPNIRYYDYLKDLEREARVAHKGLWGACR